MAANTIATAPISPDFSIVADAMAAGLGEREVIRSMFGRFVSEAVAQRVLAPEEAPHSVARNGSSPWSSPICPATRP